MKPRRTQTTNVVIAYPGGTQDQDLPAIVEPGQPIRTVWRPDADERAAIATGKANVELAIWANQHPPVAVGITRDRILPIDPDERIVPPGLCLWLELPRDLVINLIDELAPAAEDLARIRNTGTRIPASRLAPLERLSELHERLLEYLPHLTPIADEEPPA